MRYSKKPKYKLKKDTVFVNQDKDLTLQQLYQERLKSKSRMAKKR